VSHQVDDAPSTVNRLPELDLDQVLDGVVVVVNEQSSAQVAASRATRPTRSRFISPPIFLALSAYGVAPTSRTSRWRCTQPARCFSDGISSGGDAAADSK
jgi:hypothetical protein